MRGSDGVGGLVGWNRGTVSYSYATGNVSGDSYVGGLVGWNDYGTVLNSYATGNVSGNGYVGGFVGYNSCTVENSFWDIETSGITVSDGGVGKTTADMMDITTFSNVGWDIVGVEDADTRNTDYIWNIVDTETYPFLSRQKEDDDSWFSLDINQLLYEYWWMILLMLIIVPNALAVISKRGKKKPPIQQPTEDELIENNSEPPDYDAW